MPDLLFHCFRGNGSGGSLTHKTILGPLLARCYAARVWNSVAGYWIRQVFYFAGCL